MKSDLTILFGQCGSGGTGRHTILRGWRRKAWGFKSPLPHHSPKLRSERKVCGSRAGRHFIMIALITAIHVIVCFFIIIVVLLQSGKSGDIAAAFGGMGSQTAFGPRGAATLLGKATTWSAVIFMITSITLSIVASRRTTSGSSVLQGLKPTTTQRTQPVPAPPATPGQPAPTA